MTTPLKGLVMLMMAVTLPAWAQTTPIQTTRSVITPQLDADSAAHLWGLTLEDWREYQAIMAGKRGTWSPGLDPITALGVHADTQAKRERLAQLYVRQAFQRTQDELAFQRAVNRAWQTLYPGQKPLQVAHRPLLKKGTYRRYALIVEEDCMACEEMLAYHLQSSRSSGAGLDIYLADSEADDTRLRAWAQSHHIPAAAVEAGQITLNHGTAVAGQGPLPVRFAQTGTGQWVRQ